MRRMNVSLERLLVPEVLVPWTLILLCLFQNFVYLARKPAERLSCSVRQWIGPHLNLVELGTRLRSAFVVEYSTRTCCGPQSFALPSGVRIRSEEHTSELQSQSN